MKVNQLAFASEPYEEVAGSQWVTPMIDGVPLTDLVADFERAQGMKEATGGYAGIVVGSGGEPLRGHLVTTGRHALLGCGCGETECWPLVGEVRFDEWSVTWDDFAQPHRPRWSYRGFGPFVFADVAYRDAVAGMSGG